MNEDVVLAFMVGLVVGMFATLLLFIMLTSP